MNIRTWASLALATASASSALVVACSSSSGTVPDLVGTGTGTGDKHDVADASADSGADASVDAAMIVDASLPDADAAGICASAKQEGEEVEEVTQDTPLTAAAGGTITPGTYVLSELDTYEVIDAGGDDGGDDEGLTTIATGYSAAKTLILDTNGTFWYIEATGTEDAGLGANMVSGGLYTTSGTNLVLASSCPATVAGTTVTYPYTVAGGSLSLYRGVHDEVYIRDVMP